MPENVGLCSFSDLLYCLKVGVVSRILMILQGTKIPRSYLICCKWLCKIMPKPELRASGALTYFLLCHGEHWASAEQAISLNQFSKEAKNKSTLYSKGWVGATHAAPSPADTCETFMAHIRNLWLQMVTALNGCLKCSSPGLTSPALVTSQVPRCWCPCTGHLPTQKFSKG